VGRFVRLPTGLATVDSQAEQSGSRLIRNGVPEIVTP
jgi:hypothetical protein